MKQFFRQTFNLLAENKLHSSIVIVGTAVTMAFVMMVVMIAATVGLQVLKRGKGED